MDDIEPNTTPRINGALVAGQILRLDRGAFVKSDNGTCGTASGLFGSHTAGRTFRITAGGNATTAVTAIQAE